MIYRHLIAVFFLVSCGVISTTQVEESKSNIYLKIDQTVSGAYSQHSFIFFERKLVIKEKLVNKAGESSEKIVYSTRLADNEYNALQDKIEGVMKLEKEDYVNPQLGGLRWEINIMLGEDSKELLIENANIPEVESLFETVNNLVPDKKPNLHPLQ